MKPEPTSSEGLSAWIHHAARWGVALCLALHLSGGDLCLLQVAAWAKMLVAYSAENGLHSGMEFTFDADHPCPLCKKIEEANNGSKDPKPTPSTPSVTTLKWAALTVVFVLPELTESPLLNRLGLWEFLSGSGRGRAEPPTPPPRTTPEPALCFSVKHLCQSMNLQHRNNRAFTLIELLVTVTIIAVLAGLTLAASSRITQYSRGTKCLANIRELTNASMLYAGDNNGALPATSHQRRSGKKSWTLSLQEYAGGKIVFRCPADQNTGRQYTYLINDFLTPNPAGAPTYNYSTLTLVPFPANTLLFSEAADHYANTDHFHFSDYAGQAVPPEVFSDMVGVERHGGKANYAFADGHVEMLTFKDVKKRLSTPGSTFVDPAASP